MGKEALASGISRSCSSWAASAGCATLSLMIEGRSPKLMAQASAIKLVASRSPRRLQRTRCSYPGPPCSSRRPSSLSLHATTVACPSRSFLACPLLDQCSICVRALLSSCMCDLPLQEPVTVLLKEYLPGARSVACNELQTLVHLVEGLPSRKWHAASAPLSSDPPIVPILGMLRSYRGPCP